jgi:nucleotide-binding universal stress UspA family protein
MIGMDRVAVTYLALGTRETSEERSSGQAPIAHGFNSEPVPHSWAGPSAPASNGFGGGGFRGWRRISRRRRRQFFLRRTRRPSLKRSPDDQTYPIPPHRWRNIAIIHFCFKPSTVKRAAPMSIRTVSLALVLGADASLTTATRYAMDLAKNAHAGLVVRIGVPPLMIPAFGQPIHAAATQMLAMVERENIERRQRAEEFGRTIENKAKALEVVASVEVFSAAYDPLLPHMAAIARVSDVCVLPALSYRESPSRDFIIDMLFGAGGPLLLVPMNWQSAGPIKRAVVAWDGSGPAARALRDALPLLQGAASVEVLSVLGEKEIAAEPSGSDVARCLASHCREVSVSTLPVLDDGVAATIFHHARDSGADLVVMGGYGHSRLREFILGGVTRDMLSHTDIPTLLSH